MNRTASIATSSSTPAPTRDCTARARPVTSEANRESKPSVTVEPSLVDSSRSTMRASGATLPCRKTAESCNGDTYAHDLRSDTQRRQWRRSHRSVGAVGRGVDREHPRPRRLDSVLVLASVATSIDSVKYTDADGNETTLASTDYSIDDTDAPTVLLLDPVPTVELARVRNPVVVAYQSALDDRQVIATSIVLFQLRPGANHVGIEHGEAAPRVAAASEVEPADGLGFPPRRPKARALPAPGKSTFCWRDCWTEKKTDL